MTGRPMSFVVHVNDSPLPAYRPRPEWPLSSEDDGLAASRGILNAMIGGALFFAGVAVGWVL